MAKQADAKTLALIKAVQEKKAQIAKAERPNWITNCSFSFTGKPGDAINLHVENDVRTLIGIAGFILDKEASHNRGCGALNIDPIPTFKWMTFSASEWLSDVKARIAKIQIVEEKKKLESLEARLNAIISPELRQQMELAEIEKAL